MSFLIFVIAILFLCAWVAMFMNARKRFRDARSGFDRFKAAHPESVRDGRISCPKCSGQRVFVRAIGHAVNGEVLNSHVCAACGAELYRSVSEAA